MINIIKFLFELGNAKRVKRSGWWLAGIKDPESIAEHMWRATILGNLIAEEEGANTSKVMKMLLFHDIPEIRLNDTHKVGARYMNTKEAEHKALEEQIQDLFSTLKNEIMQLWKEMHELKTKEAIVAKDADLLECAFQAKEYQDQGYTCCQDWINNVRKKLQTKTAKQLLSLLEKNSSTSWWN